MSSHQEMTQIIETDPGDALNHIHPMEYYIIYNVIGFYRDNLEYPLCVGVVSICKPSNKSGKTKRVTPALLMGRDHNCNSDLFLLMYLF